MKKVLFVALGLTVNAITANAQDDLFGAPKREAKKGFVISLNGSFDVPGADMAKRFGISYRLGPSFFYKTQNNWIIGAKADFIFGNKIEEDSFLANIEGFEKSHIGFDGARVNFNTFERGYMVGLQLGKIFAFSERHPDNGLLVLTSAGFMQHKILISTKNSGHVPQLEGGYKKGYDRLSNGVFVEQFVGYSHYSKNGLINFNIGLDVVAGFNKGRREYLYDVMRPGNESRFDLLFGIKGGWYIPIFKRKSEELFFQ